MSTAKYLSTQEVVENIEYLCKWFDYMAKKRKLPKTFKSFLELVKNPKYKHIKKKFGLLRLGPWRRLVYETKKSMGAFIFLEIVKNDIIDSAKGIKWPIGKWEKIDLLKIYEGYVSSPSLPDIIDSDASPDDDDDEDGTSPLKGDTPPT